MEQNYSVLMSVYYKENPEYLRTSMESMFNQSVPTNNFVLVCDGELNKSLDAVIAEMQSKHNNVLQIVRLEKNSGLGNALNEGLKHCKNELVARMDSDDISTLERCKKQLQAFQENDLLAICSGTIEEFETTPDQIKCKRKLPLKNDDIRAFSKKRNPFNHPAVMFKKAVVISVGGYTEKYHLFEDYDLWVRMLQNGTVSQNLEETLVYMRTPYDMYLRRGGKKYAQDMLRFHMWLRRSGWTSKADYFTGATPHAVVCVLPNRLRKMVYAALRW